MVSVAEPKAGDKAEAEGRESPPAETKAPVEGDKVSSKTPKTYTEKELRDAVKSAEGRAAKDVSTYKSQAETTLKALQSLQVEKGKLQELLDEDPDKASLVKKMRDLEARDQTLNDKMAAHDSEWDDKQEALKELAESKLKSAVSEIVKEYDGVDQAKLQKEVDRQSAKGILVTEQDIRDIADTFWTKKASPEEAEEEAIVPPVNMRDGGNTKLPLTSERIDKMSMEEYANHPAIKDRYKK